MIGHSFGGLLTMIVARRGLAAASVAIDSAPFRGALPLPLSALKASAPVLGNPLNRHRAVPLTYDQFRFAFASAVGEDEAHELYRTFAVPASGTPLFQAAAANLDPWTEAKADDQNLERGPLLVIEGLADNTSPPAINRAAYKLQSENEGVTEIASLAGRGHSITIDSGWREVCDTALSFIRRFADLDAYIEQSAFRQLFDADVPAATAGAMAAGQRPGTLISLGEPSGEPAWRTIPSWYLVARDDRTIPPEAERVMAARMRARTSEITSSHAITARESRALPRYGIRVASVPWQPGRGRGWGWGRGSPARP
ncbi:alpha/beta fold hydrolase [Actinoplanes sp. NPDC051494]|uniref:alpha/beta fold hydrolase n=1 Tax=Actinoplanes sp. NPDC051494 TaxID=3363907 RepID=UPI003789FBB7